MARILDGLTIWPIFRRTRSNSRSWVDRSGVPPPRSLAAVAASQIPMKTPAVLYRFGQARKSWLLVKTHRAPRHGDGSGLPKVGYGGSLNAVKLLSGECRIKLDVDLEFAKSAPPRRRNMQDLRAKMRLAIMTFVYEDDRDIALDMLESVLRSCSGAVIDVFLTDDGSQSHVGDDVVDWCKSAGVRAICLRNSSNRGYRGAVERTIRPMKAIAEEPCAYDVILRIDTDALVIRDGLGKSLRASCTDRRGLYGVTRRMRLKDRVALLLDLLPIGPKRQIRNGRIGHSFGSLRSSPVWWWRLGTRGLLHGFRFSFVEGSCYLLGGDVPCKLMNLGFLDSFSESRYGLVTSEEDVIVTLMCRAAGLPIYELDRLDPTWREVYSIGEAVLDCPIDRLPYVVHPLKPTAEHAVLRAKIKRRMPFFSVG